MPFAFDGEDGAARLFPLEEEIGDPAQGQLAHAFRLDFDLFDLLLRAREEFELDAQRFRWVRGLGVLLMLFAASIAPAEPDERGVDFPAQAER